MVKVILFVVCIQESVLNAQGNLALVAAPHSNTLTWHAGVGNGDPATGFHIYKKIGAAAYGIVADVAASTLTYVDTMVTEGTTYFYKVTAFNAATESGFSNEVSGTTPVTPPDPPPTGLSSLWTNTTVPANVTGNDPASVELGVKFSSTLAGSIVGIEFYKATNSTGTHTAHLWNAAGTSLGTGTFTGETASGWQTFTFPAPIPILPGVTYTASIHTVQYAYNQSYFNVARVMAPLTAPVNAGVYVYGSTSAFPNKIFNASNYWIDVLFQPAGPPPVTITIAPATSTLIAGTGAQQFTATVTNTTNLGVIWTATGGIVNASGFYTAGTAPGTFSVTATSAADTTKIATASVTINPPPPTLSVNCTAVKIAYTATNMPPGATLNVSAIAGGSPAVVCNIPLP